MTSHEAIAVHAPADTIAWTGSLGWVDRDDAAGLDNARRADDLIVIVSDDRRTHDLTGPAPLAAVVRVDRDLYELTVRLDRLCAALIDAAEQTTTR